MDGLGPAGEAGLRRMDVAVAVVAEGGDLARVQPGQAVGVQAGAELVAVARGAAVADEEDVAGADGHALPGLGGLEVGARG